MDFRLSKVKNKLPRSLKNEIVLSVQKHLTDSDILNQNLLGPSSVELQSLSIYTCSINVFIVYEIKSWPSA